MTSINAIRFDRQRGAIVVDETISMGGNLTYLGSDKVRNVVPAPVREAMGTVAGLAGTGSCAFSDTVKREFHDWLLSEWRVACETSGGKPQGFHSLGRMAEGLFDLVVRVKNRRMSELLRGEFGFDVPQFLEGKVEREGESHEIQDPDLTRRVTDWLSWKYQQPEVGGIFLNAILLAGYDDEDGFQIFHVDLRDGYWHRIQTCYMAEGSGRFSVDPTMYPFVEGLQLAQRRGDVDPVAGMVAMLAALNAAGEHEVGVGGYPSIMLFDGDRPAAERQREVYDDRAFLAGRVVKALTQGYLDPGPAHQLVEGLVFGEASVDDSWERLWAEARDPARLRRLLRGYKVGPRAAGAGR